MCRIGTSINIYYFNDIKDQDDPSTYGVGVSSDIIATSNYNRYDLSGDIGKLFWLYPGIGQEKDTYSATDPTIGTNGAIIGTNTATPAAPSDTSGLEFKANQHVLYFYHVYNYFHL